MDPRDTSPRPVDEAEWRRRLSPRRHHILREGGTERAFTGALYRNEATGDYLCGGCGALLFRSDDKYDSGSGWPSFTHPADGAAVTEHVDDSHFMRRTEIRCASCGGHLGHVFPDGPGPGGLRYCVNSASLDFVSDDGEETPGA